jgi:hypothetical protein
VALHKLCTQHVSVLLDCFCFAHMLASSFCLCAAVLRPAEYAAAEQEGSTRRGGLVRRLTAGLSPFSRSKESLTGSTHSAAATTAASSPSLNAAYYSSAADSSAAVVTTGTGSSFSRPPVNRRNSNTPPSPAQRAPTAPYGDAAASAAAAGSSHNTGNSSGDENDSPAGYSSSLNGSGHGNGSTVMSRSRRGSNRSGASPPPLPPLPPAAAGAAATSAAATSADAAAAAAPQPYTEANPQQVAAAFVELVRVRQEQLGPGSAAVGGITVDDLLGWSEIRDLIDEDWLTEAQVRGIHIQCTYTLSHMTC